MRCPRILTKKLLNYFFIACKAPEWLRQWPGQKEKERERERGGEREGGGGMVPSKSLLHARVGGVAAAATAMTVSVNKVKSVLPTGQASFVPHNAHASSPLTPSPTHHSPSMPQQHRVSNKALEVKTFAGFCRFCLYLTLPCTAVANCSSSSSSSNNKLSTRRRGMCDQRDTLQ